MNEHALSHLQKRWRQSRSCATEILEATLLHLQVIDSPPVWNFGWCKCPRRRQNCRPTRQKSLQGWRGKPCSSIHLQKAHLSKRWQLFEATCYWLLQKDGEMSGASSLAEISASLVQSAEIFCAWKSEILLTRATETQMCVW